MSKLIKIVFIIDQIDSNMGGTESQLIKLINGLNHETFEKYLICFKNHSWLEANVFSLKCESKVIEINGYNKLSTYRSFLCLTQFLKTLKPDIVHSFFPVANIIGVLAAKIAGVENIISSRRDYGEWMNSRYLFATKISNKFVKKIISNSNQVKELVEREEAPGKEKVEVICNGIDTALFKKVERDFNLKKGLNIPFNHKVVGIIANFKPVKQQHIFIKAAYEILKVRNDVDFILIGDGRTKREMEKLGRSLNISHKLHFVGVQNEVLPFLSIMDIGVNCSKREGLSNAIMEYMATHVPCIVTNSSGNLDLIIHNINGYTFSIDDYKTLALLTLSLLEDKETGEKFAQRAREKIEKEMSLGAMISRYEFFYGKLVDKT